MSGQHYSLSCAVYARQALSRLKRCCPAASEGFVKTAHRHGLTGAALTLWRRPAGLLAFSSKPLPPCKAPFCRPNNAGPILMTPRRPNVSRTPSGTPISTSPMAALLMMQTSGCSMQPLLQSYAPPVGDLSVRRTQHKAHLLDLQAPKVEQSAHNLQPHDAIQV